MYSRRLKIEERRNKRKAYLYLLLTIVSLYLIITYGIPSVAKFATFLLDLRKTSEPVESQDTTPPPPPNLESLPNSTKDQTLEIRGSTEEGATVFLSLNGKLEEVLADSEGKFTYSLKLRKGENTLIVYAKDASGNESAKTNPLEVTYDTEPPELEITKPTDGSEFFGSRQRQVVIEGKTEPNAKVQINDRLVVVENDGTFAFVTTLNQGENPFTVKSEDEAGNKTEKTLKLLFTP